MLNLRAVLFAMAVLVAGNGVAQLLPKRDFVLTEKEAIGILPPVVVSQGVATQAYWSPRGNYLLIVRRDDRVTPALVRASIAKSDAQPAPSEVSLLLWDARTRESRSLLKINSAQSGIGEVVWLPDSDTALVQRQSWRVEPDAPPLDVQSDVLLLSAKTGRLDVVARTGPNRVVSIDVSPTKALAVLQMTPLEMARTADVMLVGPGGPVRPAVQVQDEGLVGGIGWSLDGATPLIATRRKAADGKHRVSWMVVDTATGNLSPTPADRVYRWSPDSSEELSLAEGKQTLTLSGTSVTAPSLWLSSPFKSEYQSAFIALDATEASISPTGDALYYTSQGIGYVRSFVRMSKAEFLKVLAEAQRMEVMNKAKQAALGLLMYAADYDDNMPMKEADILAILFPYLKDGEVLKGFVYTFAGGSLLPLSSPSDTELGYIPGPGGRAVAYADGHVGWVPDKP
jgi:prepilin-type processing-associated H-X9-DG protein